MNSTKFISKNIHSVQFQFEISSNEMEIINFIFFWSSPHLTSTDKCNSTPILNFIFTWQLSKNIIAFSLRSFFQFSRSSRIQENANANAILNVSFIPVWNDLQSTSLIYYYYIHFCLRSSEFHILTAFLLIAHWLWQPFLFFCTHRIAFILFFIHSTLTNYYCRGIIINIIVSLQLEMICEFICLSVSREEKITFTMKPSSRHRSLLIIRFGWDGWR